jgi:hypothetical protein
MRGQRILLILSDLQARPLTAGGAAAGLCSGLTRNSATPSEVNGSATRQATRPGTKRRMHTFRDGRGD